MNFFLNMSLILLSTWSIFLAGWWGGGGGPCDFSVSPSPFGLDFGILDFGLGLDIFAKRLLMFSNCLLNAC